MAGSLRSRLTFLPWSILAAAAIGLTAPQSFADSPPSALELRDGDRIVWVGGTFVERMQQDNYLESLLVAAYPKQRLTVRNLGWSGDTVSGDSRRLFGGPSDGFARLVKDIVEARPSVLVVQYGANEAMEGAAGLAAFVAGLDRLLDAVADTRARVVLVSPCPREKLPAPLPDPAAYNQTLTQYEQALRQAATRRGCEFVSLADVFRTVPPPWKSPAPSFRFTDNSLHLNAAGSYLAAAAIAAKLGVRMTQPSITIDARRLRADAAGCRVDDLARSGADLTFRVVDDAGPLPVPPASANRADDAEVLIAAPLLRITGLDPGEYEVVIDDQAVRASAQQWKDGDRSLLWHARRKQAEQLRAAIRAKNSLYFHRYRPQNETYLFLFRKHEQGQNAVEIPRFDPLVKDQETLIFQWSQPLSQQVKVTKVK